MSRTPILDYATNNPIPTYTAPVDVDPLDRWVTEAGDPVITEAGLHIIVDNPLNSDD